MKCYFHPKKDAVGMCSLCYKAVCKDCVGTDNPEIVCVKCVQRGVQRLKEEKIETRKYEEPVKQVKIKRHVKKGPGFFDNFFKSNSTSENNMLNAEIITPVLFIGIISGILCGIPLLSMLFFIILPIAGIVSIFYLKAESDYKSSIGAKKAVITGLLTGAVASIISLIVTISLQSFFGMPVYNILESLFGFLGPGIFNIIVLIGGGDFTLSLNGILIRLGITIISFPILTGLFAYISAKLLK